jgi:hypothetical protein
MSTREVTMHNNSLRWLAVSGICFAAACASDGDVSLVGTHHVVEREVPVAVVETLRIHLPFDASVKNTQEKRILLRGEDNLLSEIDVNEVSMSRWEIVADTDAKVTQHSAIEIEVPFIDMVWVTSTANVKFQDKPAGSSGD